MILSKTDIFSMIGGSMLYLGLGHTLLEVGA
jgi:hypothetical protein